jgi:hypothetical protein
VNVDRHVAGGLFPVRSRQTGESNDQASRFKLLCFILIVLFPLFIPRSRGCAGGWRRGRIRT